MNRSAMPRPAIASILPALLLAACQPPTTSEEPPLAGAAIGGPFELVNSEGDTVRWSDFDGKYRIVYFGYAYCPDACPFDMQRLIKGYNEYKKLQPELAAQVQPIFISIDPARDTPEVIGEFTAAFSDDLIGLTGTPAQVDQAAKAFAAPYNKVETGSEEGYLMSHPRIAYLMGRNGEPIALLPVEKDGGDKEVTAELEKWVS
jgi:protein SCO1/2